MCHPLSRSPHSRAGGPGAIPVLLGLLALWGLALAGGCLNAAPVLVGFSGPLTGRWADLGVQGRNGATLAVEDMNARGGVAGRLVELLVADEGDTPAAAAEAVRSLDARGAAVLVGLMTSTAAMAGLPVAEAAGLSVVSPTATTTRLTGRADAFYRVTPDLEAFARILAEEVARRQPGCRILEVRGEGNQVFSEPFAHAFAFRLAELGGAVAGIADTDREGLLEGRVLARQIQEANATGVLALLPARALAKLALRMRSAPARLPVYAVMWGFNNEFLEMAGDSAEGVASCVLFPYSTSASGMDSFSRRYMDRFGYAPASGAFLAYEAVCAAALALERTGGERQGMAQALGGLEKIPGLCGDLSLDRYGDVKRPIYPAVVRDRAIHTEVGPGG